MTEKKKAFRTHIDNFLAALPPLAWAAAFVLWAFGGNRKGMPALITAAAFCLLCALATIRVIGAARSNSVDVPFVPRSRADSHDKRHPFGRILLFALAARILLVAAVYLIDRKTQGGYAGGIFDRIVLWRKSIFLSPAGRLIGSSPEMILGSAGPGCFPLFPAVCTWIAPAFPEPFFAGMAVSNLFSVIAAPLLWEFVLIDGTVRDARRSLVFLLLSPVALVFLYANEASSALAFGLAALIFSRRHKPLCASVCALIAVLIHPFSTLLIVPIVCDRLGEISLDRALGTQKSFVKNMLSLFFAMLPGIGLALPTLFGELAGSTPTGAIDAIPFFEETVLRVTKLTKSFPEGMLNILNALIPVIVPVLPPVIVLFSAKRLKPKYGAALTLGVLSLSVLSVREVFPVYVSSPLILAGLSAIGRHPVTRILLIVFSVVSFALMTYALGAGLM